MESNGKDGHIVWLSAHIIRTKALPKH